MGTAQFHSAAKMQLAVSVTFCVGVVLMITALRLSADGFA